MSRNVPLAAMLLAGAMTMSATRAETAPAAAPARADHLAIHVADQDVSVAFYRDAFGLAEIPNPVDGPRWFDLGSGMSLHIIPGRTEPLRITRSVHLALRVASIDDLSAWLAARGIEWQDYQGVEGKVQIRPDGVRQIYLQDPDGYWLEVNEAPRH